MYILGEVKVSWTTLCDDESPYSNLSGVETFQDGEETTNIQMEFPELPLDHTMDQFSVVLSPIKSSNCKLGTNTQRPIEITNDIGK